MGIWVLESANLLKAIQSEVLLISVLLRPSAKDFAIKGVIVWVTLARRDQEACVMYTGLTLALTNQMILGPLVLVAIMKLFKLTTWKACVVSRCKTKIEIF